MSRDGNVHGIHNYGRIKRRSMEHLNTKWQHGGNAHSILIKHGFPSDISTLVDEYENIIHIRDGIREIFQLCEKKDIPIVIVSAGITDFSSRNSTSKRNRRVEQWS